MKNSFKGSALSFINGCFLLCQSGKKTFRYMSHCNNILNKVMQNSKFQKNVTNIIQNIVCYSQDTYPSWSFDKNTFLYFSVTL